MPSTRRRAPRAAARQPPGASLPEPMGPPLDRLRAWFQERGWTPYPFQEQAWAAYARGESGLIHVPTGAGKTYAAYMGPLADVAERGQKGLQILYVTPLRAVSRDVELALRAPLSALGADIEVESRTGDTSSSVRQRQRQRLPEVLITTPESLSLLLANERAAELFASLRAVIADEWHELLSTKRGTQMELALARLRHFAPSVRTWALSATLANLGEAARAGVGTQTAPTLLSAELERPIEVSTLLPDKVDSFPWAGHLGFSMLEKVAAWLDPERSTLLFTNTRSQAERWYEGLRFARPEFGARLALHHGSIDREERERVEAGLKDGSVRLVVCTSSLDLGVDFGPVERVVQVGSPKGISRSMQRAGRSGHRPGETCRLLFVPTHALELMEMAAARQALERGEVEARVPLSKPLDVLAQHLVTCALGGGFTREAMRAEVREAASYAHLTDEEFEWTLALVREGGPTLRAYPEFRRVVEHEGRFIVADGRIARLHRLNIGTIASDATVQLRYWNGGRLGSVEESYVSRLRPGDTFLFSGKRLEFSRFKDMTAYVKPAKAKATQTPRWGGSRLPLSGSLAAAVRRTLNAARYGDVTAEELAAAWPVLEAQSRLSRIPGEGTCLAETCETRDGHHLFLYPFEGRLVHEGLAALLALRFTRRQRATFSLSVNDYGIEFLTPDFFPFEEALRPSLFTRERLVDDILESVNLSELARRQFRDVARVAGLVLPGLPGARKSTRQVQASASLLYDVFSKYDPDNLLLVQARREVLEQQFEQNRLAATLERLERSTLEFLPVRRPTPLGFPLVIERISASLSNESLLERVARLKERWQRDDARSA
ncbi:ligase-associated DNA damage response DEXH box helicase [Stigmatella aurantiaca]|uniref:ATP-dependent helicase, DEAD/DEAH box family n=1 Tax=Stigmatella aurantiaca (strain DW4/3-1) TaxID=378806 RepID=Q08Z18_STIAD|nr:ligase-associated DNA damage response DEXH box helicase [Stigmatella aurantiaca]ADO74525.1 ATP-dependent helicase, DEAD/DEAH box family [Stigmatella aurantiaca DW4/3-1]EAU65740.1 heliCase, c-terminal:dead/deah box helicase, n-terminal [Stigmatella aurantiaca DW4/3-1]